MVSTKYDETNGSKQRLASGLFGSSVSFGLAKSLPSKIEKNSVRLCDDYIQNFGSLFISKNLT